MLGRLTYFTFECPEAEKCVSDATFENFIIISIKTTRFMPVQLAALRIES